ncbi:MAG: hypothetical protein AAF492_30825, partial [Verrucomicrobiota bacterium]
AGSALSGITLRDIGGLNVGSVGGQTGLKTTNSMIDITSDGHLTLLDMIDSGTGITRLTTTNGGNLTQAGGEILADFLAFQSAGVADLSDPNNAVGTVAGMSAGSMTIVDSDGLLIHTVAGLNGLTTVNSPISVQAGGTLELMETINSGSARTRLATMSGGSITQSMGALEADGFEFNASGDVFVSQTGNDFDAVAGTAVGVINLFNAAPLRVTTVGSESGLTAGGSNITIQSVGTLTLDEHVDIPGGRLLIQTVAGGVDQTGGSLTADGMAFNAQGPVTLLQQENNLNVVNGIAQGAIRIVDTNELTVGAVPNPFSIAPGLSSGGQPIEITADGDLMITERVVAANSQISLTTDNGGTISQTSFGQ